MKGEKLETTRKKKIKNIFCPKTTVVVEMVKKELTLIFDVIFDVVVDRSKTRRAWRGKVVKKKFEEKKEVAGSKTDTYKGKCAQRMLQWFFFRLGLGCGQRTARMDSSKTFLRPFCVRAEHSRYLTAPISLAIPRPCG